MNTKYSKHFLKQVIFQSSYNVPSIKNALDNSLKELCSNITGQQVQEGKNTNVSFAPNQPSTTEINSRWVFFGKDIQIVIQHDFLQVINLSYSNYSHFHSIIETVFNKLKEVYNPSLSRISLRYTNNISFDEGNTFDFKGLINDELLNSLTIFKDQGLRRSIGQMYMNDDEMELATLFTFGFSNSQFPNKIIKREFLLDYDCSVTYTQPTDNITSITEITLKIRNKVNELFEKSILEGLREKMYEQSLA
jgi:uncharacterized protein (TIGR04255 family)